MNVTPPIAIAAPRTVSLSFSLMALLFFECLQRKVRHHLAADLECASEP